MDPKEPLFYATTHEWARRDHHDPLLVTVGISHHAQAELTDIVFAELPSIEAPLVAGAPAAVVESVKAASDIYAPLSGRVVEINEKLASEPGLINTDPFGEGWLFKIHITQPQEWNSLLTEEEYHLQIHS